MLPMAVQAVTACRLLYLPLLAVPFGFPGRAQVVCCTQSIGQGVRLTLTFLTIPKEITVAGGKRSCQPGG